MNGVVNLSPFLVTKSCKRLDVPLGFPRGLIVNELTRTLGGIDPLNIEPDFKYVMHDGISPYSDEDLVAAIISSDSGEDSSTVSLKETVMVSRYLRIAQSVGINGANQKADTIIVQKELNNSGYLPKLALDGSCGNKTNMAIKSYQKGFLASPDGRVGPKGETSKKLASGFKYEKHQASLVSVAEKTDAPVKLNVGEVQLVRQSWPMDKYADLVEYFGEPGSNWTTFKTPYPLRLSWAKSTIVNKVRCNKKVADSLERILSAILNHYGSLEKVQEVGLDLYGGCSNKRKMRGGTKWSRHSWGVAIDLNPSPNSLHTPWPGKATMPLKVIEIFEAEGWKSGGRAWGRDAMHFQATK